MSKANASPPTQGRKGGRHSPGLFHPKRERVAKASQFNTKKGRRLAQDRQHDCPNQSVLLHRLQSPGQGDGDMPAPRGDQGRASGTDAGGETRQAARARAQLRGGRLTAPERVASDPSSPRKHFKRLHTAVAASGWRGPKDREGTSRTRTPPRL